MQAKKPDFKIFAGGAEDGELHDFPDVTRGWGVTKLQTNKKPPLSWMNGAFNRVDNNFYYLLQNGLAEWNSEIGYSVGALSQVDGVIYRAKEASKGESPAASAKWEKLFADKVGTSDFIGMSQSAIKKELDKKINSSGLTQTITSDKLKAPSNFAVNTALKEQDPRQWGFGSVNGKDVSDVSKDWFIKFVASPANKAPAATQLLRNLSTESSYNFQYSAINYFAVGGTFGAICPSHLGEGVKIVGGYRTSETGTTILTAYNLYTDRNTSIDPNGVLTTKHDTVTLTTKDLAKESGNSHSKVMTQKAASDAFQPKGDYGLGIGQEWVNVTGTIKKDVNYTNGNRSIEMYVASDGGRDKKIAVVINGVTLEQQLFNEWSQKAVVCVIIPANATYKITGTGLSYVAQLK